MQEKKIENIQIGTRIKSAREAAGYTQERLAELLDVTAQYISGLERGTVGLSIPVLIRMCNVLLVSTDFILVGQIQKPDVSVIIERLQRLPLEHIKNAEAILALYMEGIAISKYGK